MAKRQKTALRTIFAIEVGPSQLYFARVTEAASGDETDVQTYAMTWRREASSIHTETGAAELAAAMKQLVSMQRLGGQQIYLTLNSEFCVTRVVTGTEDQVRREMAALEERSSRYLSLGQGPKTIAASIQQIDARHQHALLTVANQKVPNTIVRTAEDADQAFDYLKVTCAGTTPDDVLRLLAQRMTQVPASFERLAQVRRAPLEWRRAGGRCPFP